MKKSVFTIAFVAVAAISANACNPSNPFRHLLHKTVALEAAEKTGQHLAAEKDYGPMLKNVAFQSEHHPTIFEPLLR